jgi:hypothetical protein
MSFQYAEASLPANCGAAPRSPRAHPRGALATSGFVAGDAATDLRRNVLLARVRHHHLVRLDELCDARLVSFKQAAARR